jgi:hypothetical protein
MDHFLGNTPRGEHLVIAAGVLEGTFQEIGCLLMDLTLVLPGLLGETQIGDAVQEDEDFAHTDLRQVFLIS